MSFLLHLTNTILEISTVSKNCDLNNDVLRPLSLLTRMSKIVKNVIKTQVLEYCERVSLLHSNQFAFRKNHNTTSALLSLTDPITRELDNRESCVLIK